MAKKTAKKTAKKKAARKPAKKSPASKKKAAKRKASKKKAAKRKPDDRARRANKRAREQRGRAEAESKKAKRAGARARSERARRQDAEARADLAEQAAFKAEFERRRQRSNLVRGAGLVGGLATVALLVVFGTRQASAAPTPLPSPQPGGGGTGGGGGGTGTGGTGGGGTGTGGTGGGGGGSGVQEKPMVYDGWPSGQGGVKGQGGPADGGAGSGNPDADAAAPALLNLEGAAVGSVPLPQPVGDWAGVPEGWARVGTLIESLWPGTGRCFMCIAAGESRYSFTASNPAGRSLSKASIDRQMNASAYGKPGGYGAYLAPEKQRNLGAEGAWQLIAGTAGQAGWRRQQPLGAPRDPDAYKHNPAYNIAMALELAFSLHWFYVKERTEWRDLFSGWKYPRLAGARGDADAVSRAQKLTRRIETGAAPGDPQKLPVTGAWSMYSANYRVGTPRFIEWSPEQLVYYLQRYDYAPAMTRGLTMFSEGSTVDATRALIRLADTPEDELGEVGTLGQATGRIIRPNRVAVFSR